MISLTATILKLGEFFPAVVGPLLRGGGPPPRPLHRPHEGVGSGGGGAAHAIAALAEQVQNEHGRRLHADAVLRQLQENSH